MVLSLVRSAISALVFVTQRGCVESVVVLGPGTSSIRGGYDHELGEVLSTWIWSSALWQSHRRVSNRDRLWWSAAHRCLLDCFFSRRSACYAASRQQPVSVTIFFFFYFEREQVTWLWAISIGCLATLSRGGALSTTGTTSLLKFSSTRARELASDHPELNAPWTAPLDTF